MAALHALVDASFDDALVTYSANLGYFLEADATSTQVEAEMIAMVRMIDPLAGAAPQT